MVRTEVIVRNPVDKDIIVAREQRKSVKITTENELLRELIRNPVFEIIMTYIIIETLQKAEIIPSLAGTAAEAACITAVAAQQIAPLMPAILQSTTSGAGSLTKLIPKLL